MSRLPREPGETGTATREFARNVAFLSPWLLGTGLFFLYPLVTTAYLSFTHYDGFTSPTWVGLDNWHYVCTTIRSSGRRCATPCGSCW